MDDKWVRNVRESPAMAAARGLRDLLLETSSTDHNLMSDISKVRREAERAVWVLENCDPYLVPQVALDGASAALLQAAAYVEQFRSSGAEASVGSVMAHVEAALVHLSAAAIPGESVSPSEQMAGLSRTVSEHRDAVWQEMSALVEALRGRVGEVEQQRQIAETQNVELAAKVDLLRTELDALRQTSSTLTTQWQSSFTEEQSSRAEQFRALLDEQRQNGSKTTFMLDQTVQDALAIANVRVVDAVAAIDASRATAEGIVGIISDTALIGEPSKRAAEDHKQAVRWSLGSVGLGLVAVLIAVVALSSHTRNDSDWVGFALKALAVAAVGGVSTYAARQAHEHRRAQREQEHMAVQLSAIKPFLRDMDPTNRDEVLRDIAHRLFGQPLGRDEKSADGDVLPPGTLQLIQVIAAALKTKG